MSRTKVKTGANMPTRFKTQRDKEALKEMLRAKCRAGEMAPGERLPTLRELTALYGLSMPTVADALRELVMEGTLYSVPRVGTFVGQGRRASGGLFAFVSPYALSHSLYLVLVHRAFEAAIAGRGGSCLTLTRKRFLALRAAGELPELSGAFFFDADHEAGVGPVRVELDFPFARAVFMRHGTPVPAGCDSVEFDELEGGRQATRHLLERGHRRIAFLGLHTASNGFGWSRERERGWRQVLDEAGAHSRSYLPPASALIPRPGTVELDLQRAAANHALRTLLPELARGEVDAVIAVNHRAAEELFRGLGAFGVPRDHWPAVVSFDDATVGDSHLISTVRLPWEDLGRGAADRLMMRAANGADTVTERLCLPLTLVPRLTSEPRWWHPAGMESLTMHGASA